MSYGNCDYIGIEDFVTVVARYLLLLCIAYVVTVMAIMLVCLLRNRGVVYIDRMIVVFASA